MSTDLGTAHGNVVINAAPALAALAALRRENASTIGAMNTTGRAAQTAGAGLIGIGAGITAVFAIAVQKSADLEKRLSYIKGITKITDDQMKKLRETVIQLGQDSAYTAGEVADGFTELAKAGASTEQMIGGMGEAMITLGQAADIPLDKAASALVSISSTFGLAASESERIANVMSGAANASIISVEDMAVSFKYAGGVAANLGVSLEDTATAIAILGNAGIKGSTAGTSLRRIFLQLTPRTDKAAAAMKDLGIITADGANKFYDATGKAKKMSEIVEILKTSLSGLNPEQQQKALATIFGDRAINSAIALSKEGAAGFKAMNDELHRSTAADVAKERLNNLAGAIEILKGTIDSALIRAGAPAQKPLQKVVELITKLINIFNNLPGPVQQAIVYFLLAIAALSLLSGGILLTFGTMLRAAAVIKQLSDAFKVFGILLKQAAWLMKMFSLSLLTNPVFLIIAALVLLGVAFYLLWTRSETFRNGVKKLWATMKEAFWAVVDWFKDLPAHIDAAWESVKKFFSGIGSAIADWVSGAWDAVGRFFSRIGSGIADAFNTVVSYLGGLPGRIAGAIGDAGSAMFDAFMGDAQDIPEALGHWLGLAIGTVVRFFYDMGVTAWHGMQTIWDFVWTGAQNIYNAVVEWFQQLPGRIAGFFTDAWNATTAWVANMWNTLTTGGGNMFHGIVDWLQQLPGRIGGFFTDVYNRAVIWAANLVLRAREMGGNFLSAIGSFFSQLPGRVGGWITGAYNAVVGFIGRFGSAAASIGRAVVDGITGFITGLPGTVTGIIGRVISAFTGMISAAFNAARSFASGLWNGFKEGLGIHSPSFIEEAMFDIDRTGENTIGALRKQVRTLQRLGAGVPTVTPSSALTGPSVVTRGRPPSDPDAMLAAAPRGDTHLTVNYPEPEPVSDGLPRTLRNLDFVGAIG